jgi:peptidoglycan hydrolase-like protein with peptidoglycan-binding domain
MFTVCRQPSSSFATPLKPIVGIATAALLIGWAAGVSAQSTNPSALPPLPPATQGATAQNNSPPSAPAAAPQAQAALPASNANFPPLPLGHDDVRELQNQLIALGFDPGAADGQGGPATDAAAQQYDQSRGGSGRASIDSALLARLKADTAPRLTYDQVAARAQSHSQAQAPASAGNQIGSIVQQLAPLIGAAVNSTNNNNCGPYGCGGYPGPYGPGGFHYGY